MEIVNPLPWDGAKRAEMKAQAEAKYYPADIDFALAHAHNRIDEWSYDEDAHGWCHERPALLALVEEVERLQAIQQRAQELAEARGDHVLLSDQVTARWILGDPDYGT